MKVISTTKQMTSSKDKIVELVDYFLASTKGTPSTKAVYKRRLKQFLLWTNYNLQDVDAARLEQYRQHLLDSNKSISTVNDYLGVVRKLYNYLHLNYDIKNVALGLVNEKIEKDEIAKKPQTVAQVHKVLEYSNSLNLRDKLIINLLYSTALRTIEVHRMLIGDIEQEADSIIIKVQRKGKKKKKGIIVLAEPVADMLAEYLKSLGPYDLEQPLFASTSNNSKGKPLSTRTISGIVKKALRNTIIKLESNDRLYTAHSVRHTALGTLKDAKVGQVLLGHQSILTTEKFYTDLHNSEERITNAPEKKLAAIYYPNYSTPAV